MKFKSFSHYLKAKPWHWWLAILITLLAGFLRLYQIPDTLMFLGDQGRDAILVSQIFKNLELVFIGPVTSVGNMYLGPFYYYFMLPFLWLSYPSPLGPVYAVAILSTLTVYLIYALGKKMFSPTVGLMASFFLAFSSEAIYISRFSWNPNLAPLFSLLMIYFSWKAIQKPKNWLIVAILFSLIIQLHYLTLLTGASIAVIWIFSIINLFKKTTKENRKKFLAQILKISSACLVIFILSLTPQILFDIKHQGLNVRAFINLFTKEDVFGETNSIAVIERISSFSSLALDRSKQILIRVPLGKIGKAEAALALSLIGLTLVQLWINFKKKLFCKFSFVLIIFSFLSIGVLGTSFYKETVYNHYIAYLYPVFGFIFALALELLLKLNKKLLILPVLGFLSWFLINNYYRSPLQTSYLYQRTQNTSQQVYQNLTKEDKYEIVLLSETKDLYGQSYRYFLLTTDKPPIIRDKGETPNTLVIIDEEKKVSDILQSPIYEIVTFPYKNIDQHIVNEDQPDIYILREPKN